MREKLIALLSESVSKFCKLSVIRGTTKITAITVSADEFADRLIANGVTIPVRCKDCSYWEKATANKKGFLICPASGMEIMADDFCSYGERRTDD